MKWGELFNCIHNLIKAFEDLPYHIFIIPEKGEGVRLVLFPDKSIHKAVNDFTRNSIKKYLKKTPTSTPPSNIEFGKTLWMNYPNNSLYENNFKFHFNVHNEFHEKDKFLFNYSQILSTWILKNPFQKEDLLSVFLQLIITISKLHDQRSVCLSIQDIINKIFLKHELMQDLTIAEQIRSHACADLVFNFESILELNAINASEKTYDTSTWEFFQRVSNLLIVKPQGRSNFVELIMHTILHLGLDYRGQLYVLYLVQEFFIKTCK
ncbi:hypothetical protein [Pedobacter duraquae]|uniref:Thiopeptide-type bacteriocin biosynthesis protein n=1 Tax=Pedobacter duraquae TaxID=425511 RepID=A0A4R6IJZ3_9SPHI|nr:hypothetical protein [Pedobacter duraquae]TDO22362.1 hypothetical protein CLV32_1331 [Pedobacter duraquae]